jgi:hypothetical protein
MAKLILRTLAARPRATADHALAIAWPEPQATCSAARRWLTG